jgi:hypothetical protein
MAQQAKAAVNYQSPLHLVKTKEEYQAEVKQLTTTAWQIACTALWNTLEFSAQEKQNAVNFITAFITEATSHKKAYAELIQRILLARQYISTHPGTYAPIPSQWFNEENKKGFIGTKQWLNTVEQTRAALPLYKQPLKAFAEAVLETVQSNSANDFHYWRSYFIQHNCQGLLNLFLSTMANIANTAD